MQQLYKQHAFVFQRLAKPVEFQPALEAAAKDAGVKGEDMKKIMEIMHRFGILVIRAIWPINGKGNMKKLGAVILGVVALLGVMQASGVQKWLSGSARINAPASPQVATQPMSQSPKVASPSLAEPAIDDSTTTSGAPNIVDLVADSETIIRGAVKEVTDGFENGVPYTQVTVDVSETLRGQVGSEYTFRQFGLTKPRSMGDGRVYLGVSPEGWSKYAVGENAMLFLFKPASMTGLQTTVGLGQGKIMFEGGNAISQAGNEGLFENVEVNANLLNDKDKRLLSTKRGAVNADGLLSFVRRAVQNRWIEGGKMRHAKK
jgi:hypothetical protein